MFYHITFPLISATGTYFIFKLRLAAFIGGRRLKEGDVYFKVRRVIHLKIQNFVIASFQITINIYHCDIYSLVDSGAPSYFHCFYVNMLIAYEYCLRNS